MSISRTTLGIGVCGLLFSIALPFFSIPQMGLSWDEPFQRHYGEVLVKNIVHRDPALYTDSEKYYGPFIPLIEYLPEAIGIVETPIAIYESRHWINWFLFLTGLPFVYLLSRRSGLPHPISLIAVAIVATTPLIATHALFNSKDIPFLSACGFITWLFLWTLDKPTLKRSILLGIGFAIAILCRINAMMVIALMIASSLAFRVYRNQFKYYILPTALSTGLFTYLGWPTLWKSPFTEFKAAFVKMLNYPWEGSVLFNGKILLAQDLPWTYIPVWMGISLSPVLITVSVIAVGMGLFSIRHWIKTPNPVLTIIGGVSVLPVLFGIVFGTTFYDGWRHLFFIYPGLIIMMLYGLTHCGSHLKWLKWRPQIGIGIGILYLANTLFVWATYFPYAHCYLNTFAGPRESIIYNWEMDYWGVSYRELLNELPSSTLFLDNFPAEHNLTLVSPWQLQRLRVVNDPKLATLFITNHRLRPGPLPFPIVVEIVRDGFPLSRAYRIAQ